ncbi:hypothetical protein KSP40_PGU014439 [Platanthera guangdongensis]|uniref:DUF4408 domain-containing protein n=1 Tax=Platanthera guangdongensis TaxID=2320717 RepID=A0ABR2LZE5_9ASPA
MAISPGTIGTTEYGTGIMTAVRIAFLLVGIASTAVIIASIVVPYSTDLLSTSLPRIRSIAASWLSPSYLFVTVHFIIFVIWKLQGNNQMHQSAKQKEEEEEEENEEAEIQYQMKPPENILCAVPPVTTETSVSDPADSNPDPADPITTTAPEEAHDTMDATWKSIVEGDGGGSPESVRPRMRKSDTWERCNREFSPAAAALEGKFRKSTTFRRASVGRDELFGRAEAFIRTHYEQRRIQRQESEQRYAEMVNAAC